MVTVTFVASVSQHTSIGPMVSLVTTAGLAKAVEALGGSATIVTPDGVLSAHGALEAVVRHNEDGYQAAYNLRRSAVRELYRDARRVVRGSRFARHVERSGVPPPRPDYVWSRHGLFESAAVRLSHRLGVPLVTTVHAAIVDEARTWGINRPGWASLAEHLGEARTLRQADICTCVSQEVAAHVRRMGISDDRLLITPNCPDLDLFHPQPKDTRLASELGIPADAVTVGWVGGFRPQHGVTELLERFWLAKQQCPSLHLLLVGDGPLRQHVEDLLTQRTGAGVHLAGAVPYPSLPRFLSLADITVLTAPEGASYHYSPVKLREYMASGKAVVAERVGEVGRTIKASEGVLVEPGNASAFVAELVSLANDPERRTRLGQLARLGAEAGPQWADHVRAVNQRLGIQ